MKNETRSNWRRPGEKGRAIHKTKNTAPPPLPGKENRRRAVLFLAAAACYLFAAASTGQELKKLIGALPGFGEQKARIFVALLGKQWGVTPDGWREAAGDFGQDGHRSVADITSPETLRLVREHKQRPVRERARP